MLCPSLPGYDVTCVGDDIAWLRFDSNGDLRAINPENGFFGVAPGTSDDSNPVAMKSIFKNTGTKLMSVSTNCAAMLNLKFSALRDKYGLLFLFAVCNYNAKRLIQCIAFAVFTNVALTDDGGVWWEGMTRKSDTPSHLIDWTGQDWTPDCGRKAAHPNSRFCAPAENCPILDGSWEDPKGVKIEAILFGGRRPQGVPLVSEAFSWEHGVFLGAGLKSEATAAAEHKGKEVMHDPFSMRPFFGYNFGSYLGHWLRLGSGHEEPARLPRMFMVNWFRKSEQGGFLWPGFGENVRVLDWILRRCDGDEGIARESPVGLLPTKESMNLEGIEEDVEWDELFSTPVEFWREEVAELRNYFTEQVGSSLPSEITKQLNALEDRFES